LENVHGIGVIADPTEEWLRRAFAEIWIRRPMAKAGEDSIVGLKELLVRGWLGQQIAYHEQVTARNNSRNTQLSRLAFSLFLVSIVAAVLHSLGVFGKFEVLGFLSVVVPAVGAAVSGYAAHREFAHTAQRSQHVAARLREVRAVLETAESLATVQELALSAEQLMRGESAEWYAYVQIHEMELPG